MFAEDVAHHFPLRRGAALPLLPGAPIPKPKLLARVCPPSMLPVPHPSSGWLAPGRGGACDLRKEASVDEESEGALLGL